MNRWPRKRKGIIILCLLFILTILLLLIQNVCGVMQAVSPSGQPLNVALYPYVPDVERFEETVRTEWAEIHEDVPLNFVTWDCYHEDPSDALDVFVFDAMFLSYFVDHGYLLSIPENKIHDKADLLPFAMDGCLIDGSVYAIPQITCTNLLFTRKADRSLSSVSDVDTLYEIMGDRKFHTVIPDINEGLLIDMSGGTTKVSMYLDALCDENRTYNAYHQTPDMENVSPEALNSLKLLCRMGGAEQVEYEPDDGDEYVRARWFGEGHGRAYIGYTESISAMGDAIKDMDFRAFSYTKGENIPVLFCDVAGIRSSIEEDRKELAYDLLNTITSNEVMTEAISLDTEHCNAQYLLPGRISVYDQLSSSYPVYLELKDIVMNPDNRVFRIGSKAREFIREAKEVLPTLVLEDTVKR